jgi:TolB-like protein
MRPTGRASGSTAGAWPAVLVVALGGLALAGAPSVEAQGAVMAVLPFENTGSYGQDREAFEALAAGLPEILAATLAAHPGIRVADRDRIATAVADQHLGPAHRVDAGMAKAMAQAVGARYAVAGSFADFYGKFRINARVVDGETGEILKVVSNDDPKLQDRAQLGGVLELVAERIAAAVGLPPLPEAVAARRRALPTEALLAFSRGVLLESRGNRAKAAEAYQQALAAAPDLAEAGAGLARVR